MEPVTSPVNVIGDVHGQFYDVLKIFQLGTSFPLFRGVTALV
jgi:hypothetical protein